MSKYNRPINRDYFKLKEDPNALTGDKFMKCCGSEKDQDVLNVKKKLSLIHISEPTRPY